MPCIWKFFFLSVAVVGVCVVVLVVVVLVAFLVVKAVDGSLVDMLQVFF